MLRVNLLPAEDMLRNEADALVHRGHTICLDPVEKHLPLLRQCAGTARRVWNWGLGEWNRLFEVGEKPNANQLKKDFNTHKYTTFPWLHDMPRDTHSQPFADLGVAWSNYFAGQRGDRPPMGKPSFKRKGEHDSFYVANDKLKVRTRGKGKKQRGEIYLPKIGWVRMTEALRWPGRILSARVFLRADRWYVSINVEVRTADVIATTTTRTISAQAAALRPKRPIIGVDLGLKTSVQPSRGAPFFSPKPLLAALEQLRRAQRELHRRKKGSQNRHKTQKKIARIYARIADIRKDFWHKVTTALIRENQAVVIEDLGMAFMLKNRKLSRAASDVALGMFRPMLTYKAAVALVEVIVADKIFPSTQRCRCCGVIKVGDERLTLSDRIFHCDQCGHEEERDLNSAHNMEQYPRLEGNWRRGVRSDADADERTSTEISASMRRTRKSSSRKQDLKWKLNREDSHERTT